LQQGSVKSRIVSYSLQMHPVLTVVHLLQISECVSKVIIGLYVIQE